MEIKLEGNNLILIIDEAISDINREILIQKYKLMFPKLNIKVEKIIKNSK